MADCANITRRNAFKALASLPVLAGGLAAVTFGIDALLEEFAAAKAERDAASLAVEQAATYPGRPAWPKIERTDFAPPMQFDAPRKSLFTVEDIGDFFDYIDKKIEFNSRFNKKEVVSRWKSQSAAERARIFELFAERQRSYADWAERSGLREAEARYDVAVDWMRRMDDQILDYRPKSIEEVRAKATYLQREWLNEDEDESYVIRVVKSLAPLPFEA